MQIRDVAAALDELGVDRVDYMKINIEGAEFATCEFCAFAAKKDEPRAYTMALDEVFRTVEALPKATREVHVVGGLHPDLPWSYFVDMLRGIKRRAEGGPARRSVA